MAARVQASMKFRCRHQPLAVGTPGDAFHLARVAVQGQQFLPACRVPHLCGAIIARNGQPLPIGAQATLFTE